VPTQNAFPAGITVGPDSNVWITEQGGSKIGKLSITPTISVATGSEQATAPGSDFSTPLTAHVVDTDGNPMIGVTVAFTAPADGAGGSFAEDGITAASVHADDAPAATSVVVTTDADGNAVAPTFTANAAAGSYTVTAKATGYPSTATFSLTNTESGGGGPGGTDGAGSTGNDPVAAAASGTLPFTGAPALQLLLLGVLLLGAGLGATALKRRRRRPTA
jgi:hypothetical protein